MAAKANTVEDKYTGIYVNRELSWLKFNERVLEEAENEKVRFVNCCPFFRYISPIWMSFLWSVSDPWKI